MSRQKRNQRQGLPGQAGLALLHAALKLRTGEALRPDVAVRAALRELGLDARALRQALGRSAGPLGAIIGTRKRRRPLANPMR